MVRALSLAIDREILVETGYGEAGRPTCNLVPAPEINASKNNDSWCMTQDIEGAKKLLDDAGWKPGPDGVRVKDGKKLSILYQTSTNSVRQAAQALIKQWWNELGVEVELRNIDGSVFFGADPGSPDTLQKFYADVEMYANEFDGTDPEKYLNEWVCTQAPSPANQWQGANMSRWCNKDFDATMAELAKTSSPEDRAKLIIQANDLIANSPVLHRPRASRPAVGGLEGAGGREDERLGQRALERRRLVPGEVNRRGPRFAAARPRLRRRRDAPLHAPAAALRDPDAPRHQLHHLRAARPLARRSHREPADDDPARGARADPAQPGPRRAVPCPLPALDAAVLRQRAA